jgi:hypothetical protein
MQYNSNPNYLLLSKTIMELQIHVIQDETDRQTIKYNFYVQMIQDITDKQSNKMSLFDTYNY